MNVEFTFNATICRNRTPDDLVATIARHRCEPGSIAFVPTSVGKCTFESARLGSGFIALEKKSYEYKIFGLDYWIRSDPIQKSQLACKVGSKNVADDRTLRHSHRSRLFASGTVEVKEATGGTVAVKQWRFHDAVAWQ
ncbi:hypothetical protein WN943_006341 [Citrus x changshan-huyou]